MKKSGVLDYLRGIVMPKPIFRIFVSSTYADLIPYRKATEQAIKEHDLKFIGKEYLGARDKKPTEASLEMVEHCDRFIGTYAWRYGHIGFRFFLFFQATSFLVMNMLDIQSLNKADGNLTVDTVDGKKKTMFRGYQIRTIHQLLDTEAQVV